MIWRKYMKKGRLMLVSLLMLTLASCDGFNPVGSSSNSNSHEDSSNNTSDYSSSSTSDVNAHGEVIDFSEIEYTIGSNNSLEITKYNGDKKDIIIPRTFYRLGSTYTVTSIGKEAFYGMYCGHIEGIVLPDSITNISERAFYSAYSLRNIIIPKNVKSVGEDAFRYCDMLTIYCESETKPDGWAETWNSSNKPVYWGINENNLLEKNGIIYVVNDGKATVTGSTIQLGNNADVQSKVSIQGNDYDVIGIAYEAFRECESLLSVNIPNGVMSIGEKSFYQCKSLKSINFPNSVTTIGARAFYENYDLKTITIPSSVESIGDEAFYACNILIIYCDADSKPDGWADSWNKMSRPVYWGVNDTNYLENDGIIYLILDGKATVSGHTFQIKNKASILPKITIKGQDYDVTSINQEAFFYCTSLESITIPNSIITIGDRAFYECGSLTNLVIPNSVVSIGISAFCQCDSLEELSLPFTDTYLGYYFGASYEQDSERAVPESLKKVIITGGTEIVSKAFYYCQYIESVIIPSSVTTIGDYAFAACYALTDVEIPSSVLSIGNYAFLSCMAFEDFVIPYGVKSIGDGAFKNCQDLDNIDIPNSVTTIGEHAFDNCNSLYNYGELFIPDSVTSIGEYAFYNCISLNSISLPDSITTIENGLLSSCTYLQSIYIPSNITSIGQYAFAYCRCLDSVVIPGNVKTIGEYAFKGCTYLERIFLGNGVTTIESYAFSDCEHLKTLYIPASVTNVGKEIFKDSPCIVIYCEAESKPDGWDSEWDYYVNTSKPVYWGKNENNYFEKDGLIYFVHDGNALVSGNTLYPRELVIPSTISINKKQYNVTSIGDNAFYGSYSIESVDIPSGITTIGRHAFNTCQYLKTVKIPDTVTEIQGFAFSQCSSLVNIKLPNSVIGIESCSFEYCSALKELVIPSSVITMGRDVFFACRDLIIYCEAESQPEGWDGEWNDDGCTVYWGNQWHYDNGVPTPNN